MKTMYVVGSRFISCVLYRRSFNSY